MINKLNLRMIFEEFNNLFGVLGVALNAKRESFESLEEDEGVERRKCGACIAEQNCADVCYKCRRSYRVSERNAVIARVRISDLRVMSASLPVELT